MSSVDDGDDDEISARLQSLPDDIEAEWPEAFRISLAFGRAVRVEVPVSKRTMKRSRAAVDRLNWEPSFQADARRIFALAGDYQPFPGGGSADEIRAWDEDNERRAALIKREAEEFSAAHRFPYISPSGVVAIFVRLFSTFRRDAGGALHGAQKSTSFMTHPCFT